MSQAISEGDGISLVAVVHSIEDAEAAEEAGAEAIVAATPLPGLRGATSLPILVRAHLAADAADADACVLTAADEVFHAEERGVELVAEVRDEEELELVLERFDPEILLLSSADADEDEDPLDHVLALLPDVPAGKLAIADVPHTSREDVVALERAGVDGVIVDAGHVAGLIGGDAPPV